jgi:hypothetical protein
MYGIWGGICERINSAGRVEIDGRFIRMMAVAIRNSSSALFQSRNFPVRFPEERATFRI